LDEFLPLVLPHIEDGIGVAENQPLIGDRLRMPIHLDIRLLLSVRTARHNELLSIGIFKLLPDVLQLDALLRVAEGLTRGASQVLDRLVRLPTIDLLVVSISLCISFLQQHYPKFLLLPMTESRPISIRTYRDIPIELD
jgi:hypothetical protein